MKINNIKSLGAFSISNSGGGGGSITPISPLQYQTTSEVVTETVPYNTYYYENIEDFFDNPELQPTPYTSDTVTMTEDDLRTNGLLFQFNKGYQPTLDKDFRITGKFFTSANPFMEMFLDEPLMEKTYEPGHYYWNENNLIDFYRYDEGDPITVCFYPKNYTGSTPPVDEELNIPCSEITGGHLLYEIYYNHIEDKAIFTFKQSDETLIGSAYIENFSTKVEFGDKISVDFWTNQVDYPTPIDGIYKFETIEVKEVVTKNLELNYDDETLAVTDGELTVKRLPSGNSVEVTDTIPSPSSSNVGQVKLYSGTTTSDFTNGYLYQCKLESTLEETVTFDSDKISAPAEMFWFVVKSALPETYSSVTNGDITYTESANLVIFTFKDANNTVLGQFPGDIESLNSIGITFNNLTDGEVINFTCFSGMVDSYEWEPLIVQESSEIKIYNAPSWSRNTTLFPNCRLSIPNIDDLTEPGIFRVKYTENDEYGAINLDYLCNVSPLTASGTILGIFQSLQVIYPAIGIDSGINATLYRAKLSGGTWSDWKSPLVTSVSSNSTYSEYVSAKLFYDTCGNIEALINAL